MIAPPPTSSPQAGLDRKVQQIVLPGQTPQGEQILAILLKRTYDIRPDGRCVRAAIDKKLVSGDTHYDDPMNSTVRFESDFVPFKLATDIVLNGSASSPKREPVSELIASLTVGAYKKELLIVGDRMAHYNGRREPTFSEPLPFVTMELRYERAYGGVDVYSEPKMQYVYPRNHLGRGFVVTNNPRSLENFSLPNLEDPTNRLTPARLCLGEFKNWERQPVPQNFGWTTKMWLPRSRFAGVMPADRALEQELRKVYATLVPSPQRKLYQTTQIPDMDFRFFNGASPGLIAPFLNGDEPVCTVNISSDGRTDFRLPGEKPKLALDLGQGPQTTSVVLQTVMIRMDEQQVDLVWRGAVPYPGLDWLPQAKKMEVLVV